MQTRLKVLKYVASKLQLRSIDSEDGEPYLSRYCIYGWMPGKERKYPFSIYLHRFHTPDLDRALHNHPWKWAVSLVLNGGYLEKREASLRRLWPGNLNIINHDTFHCIREIEEKTWTLFIVGPKVSSWGFSIPGRGFVPWRQRLRERGIEPTY